MTSQKSTVGKISFEQTKDQWIGYYHPEAEGTERFFVASIHMAHAVNPKFKEAFENLVRTCVLTMLADIIGDDNISSTLRFGPESSPEELARLQALRKAAEEKADAEDQQIEDIRHG